MKQQVTTILEKISQLQAHGGTSILDYSQVEVDLAELSKALTRLVDLCLEIEKQSQVLVRSVSEL